MTPKQERFVAEYLIDLNGTQAAIRAGYSAKSAEAISRQLLRKTTVSGAIATKKSAQLERADLTAGRVLEELRRLALVDMRTFYDAAGNLKPVSEWTAEQGAAVAGFEVIKKNATAGDGLIDTIHKFKVWDKGKALEALAKHFGLLTERVEHSGELTIRHEMAE